jgi:hypothetical protein
MGMYFQFAFLVDNAALAYGLVVQPENNMRTKNGSQRRQAIRYELSPVEIINGILENPKDIKNVRSLTTKNVTYVSLNYANPDLKKVMPWCGTSYGPQNIVETFVDVGRFWKVEAFRKEAMFTDGENVAVFGRFTYKSTVLSKTATSPFSIFAKVRNGRCTYMQFMEDTFATGASFRSGGKWIFQSDPNGKEVSI